MPGPYGECPIQPGALFYAGLTAKSLFLGIRIHGQGIPCRVGAAKNAIIDGGYDLIYSRPLKRYIQAHVETMIAKENIGAHGWGRGWDAEGRGW